MLTMAGKPEPMQGNVAFGRGGVGYVVLPIVILQAEIVYQSGCDHTSESDDALIAQL